MIGYANSNSSSKTHAVGGKAANAWGLYDMSGNVREWCWDLYTEYQPGSSVDPVGPQSGAYRVYRGGSWNGIPRDTRLARRYGGSPDRRYSILGLRVVRAAP